MTEKIMTWNEFKTQVDLVLLELGENGDAKIDWIDIALPHKINTKGDGFSVARVYISSYGLVICY